MDVKVLVRMGLMLMTSEERKERLDSLVDGPAISAPALATLINEARDACYNLTNLESEAVDEQQKIQICWMLTGMDGEKIVRSMPAEELATWAIDLRENKTKFSTGELWEVAMAMMKRETP